MHQSSDELAGIYAKLGRFSSVAIGGAMGVAIRRSIVHTYVRGYLREHGRFPMGRHHVRGSYKDSRISFETRFPSNGIAALVASGHPMSVDEVWGPPPVAHEGAFTRARKQYAQSPERADLREWLLRQIEEALRNLPANGSE